MINEADWESLTTAAAGRPAGTARRRLHPGSGHDLHLVVLQPGNQRCLWYEFPADAVDDRPDLPTLACVTISVTPDTAGGRMRFEMKLDTNELADVFTNLAEDVAGAVAAAAGHQAGVRTLLDRLELWRRLLKTGPPQGLTSAERRGLYGELHVLRRLLESGIAPPVAVQAWTGPLHHHQDFQFAHAAIEIKTSSAKQPQSIPVASERELDPTGVTHLFLVHTSLDERRGGHGETLSSIADELRTHMNRYPQAGSQFDHLLHTAGLLPRQSHLYDEPHYSVRTSRTFTVNGSFPRITETQLPEGVGDVRYQIQIGVLAPFECEWTSAVATLGEAK